MHFYGRVSIFRVLWPPQRSRPATATNGLTGSLIASRRVPAVAQRDTRRRLLHGAGSGDGIAATICVEHDFPLLIYTLHSRLHNKILNPYQIQVLGRPRLPSRCHADGHHSSSCGCARWQLYGPGTVLLLRRCGHSIIIRQSNSPGTSNGRQQDRQSRGSTEPGYNYYYCSSPCPASRSVTDPIERSGRSREAGRQQCGKGAITYCPCPRSPCMLVLFYLPPLNVNTLLFYFCAT